MRLYSSSVPSQSTPYSTYVDAFCAVGFQISYTFT